MIFICALVISYFFTSDIDFYYSFLQLSQEKTVFDALMSRINLSNLN